MVHNQATYTLFSGGNENATLEDVVTPPKRVNVLPIP